MTQDSSNQAASGSDVFVSYASQDAAVANSIVENLEQHGLKCWIAPRDVKPGAQYADEIVGAINDAKVVVVVLSEHAIASPHVGKEIERASSKRRRIIALRTDNAPLTRAFEYFLSESQWIHVPALGMPAALNKLTEAVAHGATSAAEPVPASIQPVAHKKTPKPVVIAAAVVLAVVAAVGLGFYVWRSNQSAAQAPAMPAITDKSIAVLPFVDMSEKKDQEYFSDGLSEELIDLLAQTPDLQVIARTSSFYFKGKQVTIAEIAKTLGVTNVLEGSVRKSGTTLRVTAQLIRADTGVHLWSKTYDREVKDVFKVQDEVAAAVVDALKAKLLPAKPPGSAHRSNSSEAYDQYLLGKQAYNRDDYRRAVAAYRQAVKLDANFGAAYAGLAEAEADLADAETGERAALQRALEAADRAIALAPDEPDGYAARGELRFTYFWNWTGGREDIEKAMSYDVGNSTTQIRYSELLAGLGQLPQAIAAARKAVDADPLSATAWKALGKWLMNDRQFAAARQAFSRSEQINPDSVMPRWYLSETDLLDGKDQETLARTRSLRPDGALYVTALASYTLGRRTEAQQALDDYISRYSQTSAYQIAVIHAWRGETGKVFEWLDRSYAQHDSGLLWFKIDPFLSSIRADPRYGAMLKKLNLPE